MLSLKLVLWVLAVAFFQNAFARLTPPSQDPFYVQPSNIGTYAPGELIRSREISSRLATWILLPKRSMNIKSAYQYLYRTTNSVGEPVAAAATLLIPHNSDPSKLLAYQTAYDSANNDCSPSYTLRYGSAPDGGTQGIATQNSTFATDPPFMAAALNQGWWLLTSDYEGLHAEYSAGYQSGYAVLDSLRMGLAELPKVGLAKDAKYALMGYSGGSLASGWAATLQPTYAPELHFEGAALGGTVPSILGVLEAVNLGPFCGLAFGFMTGISRSHPNFTKWFDENLVPATKAEFRDIARGCNIGESNKGNFKDIFSYFKNGREGFDEPIPRSILSRDGQLGSFGTPSIPLFIYKAVGDEVSYIYDSDDLVEKWCSQGATIEYQKNLVGEHLSEDFTGSANALQWISQRFAGKPVPNQGRCVTKYIAVEGIDKGTLPVLGKVLYSWLEAIVGGKLGGNSVP